MDTLTDIDLDHLAAACLNRPVDSLFSLPNEHQEEFTRRIHRKRVMLTGAAGFIAQATLPHVLAAEPSHLFFLDSSENGLADLARRLATIRQIRPGTDAQMILADITSPLIDRAILQAGQIDVLLHFAAVKHVRSERDPTSALRILDVNVAGTDRLLRRLDMQSIELQIFAVSTDKAACPTSIMGASKAIMEQLLWQRPGLTTSTRFANVMFSSGSITASWLSRFIRGEPLSTPLETLRFFVSPAEAGLICASAMSAPDRTLTAPSPSSVEPTDLLELVKRFLSFFGKTAVDVPMDEWEKAPDTFNPARFSRNQYPVVCTQRDTAGEKQQEVFTSPGDVVKRWTADLDLIDAREVGNSNVLLESLARWKEDPSTPVDVGSVRKAIREAVPDFTGSPSTRTLDNRI